MSHEPTPPETAPAEPLSPEAGAEAPPAAPKPKSSWGGLVALVVLLLAVAAAAVTFPRWVERLPALFSGSPASSPQRETATPAGDMEMLRAELAATRERVRHLESRLSQLPESQSVAGAASADRVAALENAVRALERQPQIPARLAEDVDALGRQVAELKKTSADAAAVLRLADRIEQAEAGLRDMQSRRSSGAALLLAVGQLREAVNRGHSYDAELRALRALAPQDEAVVQAADVLKDRAAAGIPVRAALAERFEVLAPQVVRAEMLPQADTWWRETLNRLLSLVTVRREDGSAAGDGAAAVVARAKGRLDQNDLSGAARELGRLTGGPAEAAGPWVADARSRSSAEGVLSELTAHTLALVGTR